MKKNQNTWKLHYPKRDHLRIQPEHLLRARAHRSHSSSSSTVSPVIKALRSLFLRYTVFSTVYGRYSLITTMKSHQFFHRRVGGPPARGRSLRAAGSQPAERRWLHP